MSLETALAELLGNGVIEKGLLVWMILQLNGQSNNVSENKNKLNEITYRIQSIESIKLELALLQREIQEIKEKCSNSRSCYLHPENGKEPNSKNREP